MRPVLNYLYKTMGREGLGLGLNGLLVLAILFFFIFIYRNCSKGYPTLGLISALLLLGGAIAMSLDVPEERLHFLEYGILGCLVLKAMEGGWRLPFLSSFVFVSIVGGGDEAIQWLLPNRVGDLRDVLMNSFGGVLGIAITWLYDERD